MLTLWRVSVSVLQQDGKRSRNTHSSRLPPLRKPLTPARRCILPEPKQQKIPCSQLLPPPCSWHLSRKGFALQPHKFGGGCIDSAELTRMMLYAQHWLAKTPFPQLPVQEENSLSPSMTINCVPFHIIFFHAANDLKATLVLCPLLRPIWRGASLPHGTAGTWRYPWDTLCSSSGRYWAAMLLAWLELP